MVQANILFATTETLNKFDQSFASILISENSFLGRRVLGCPTTLTASGSNRTSQQLWAAIT